MKKILPICLSVLLLVALAVPASATVADNFGNEYPSFDSIWAEWPYPYATLYYNGYYQCPSITFSTLPFDNYTGEKIEVTQSGDNHKMTYLLQNGQWQKEEGGMATGIYTYSIYWANYNIFKKGGELAFTTYPLTVVECDGSACPATDVDHDNVCDDCGKALTMSLRSTEYDYAVSLADGREEAGYPFWAIFLEGERYVIHVSKNPMTSPDGETLEAEGMMYTKTTNTDGTFSLTGWYNGYYSSTDSFVYANHTIENFPLVPPILEPMEEPIRALGTKVIQTMGTLVLCGVGCLALLMVLKLFGKRSLISRG